MPVLKNNRLSVNAVPVHGRRHSGDMNGYIDNDVLRDGYRRISHAQGKIGSEQIWDETNVPDYYTSGDIEQQYRTKLAPGDYKRGR